MLPRIYSAVFVSCIFGVVFWVFSSGILERFRTIEAQCIIGGLGNVSIQHQYTNTSEKSIFIMNDQSAVPLLAKLSQNALLFKGFQIQGKLSLETQAVFITVNNKSYSGKCAIQQFSM
jgi:hypothetical protein